MTLEVIDDYGDVQVVGFCGSVEFIDGKMQPQTFKYSGKLLSKTVKYRDTETGEVSIGPFWFPEESFHDNR